MASEVQCVPCRRAGNARTASIRCLDCAEEMCRDCENVHNNLKPTRHHNIKPLTDTFPKEIEGFLPSLDCGKHPNDSIQFFCDDHKTVCCAKCTISDHRLCKSIKDINDLCSGLKKQTLLEENLRRLHELKQKAKFVRTCHTNDLCELEAEKNVFESEIADVRLYVISLLDGFEKRCLEKYNSKKREVERKIQEEGKIVQQILSNADEHYKKLMVVNEWATNSQFFIVFSEIGDKLTHFENDLRSVSQQKAKSLQWTIPVVIEQIESALLSKEISISADQKPYKTSVLINLKYPNDKSNCFFVGVDIFGDGRIAFLDSNNSSIKLLNAEHQELRTTKAEDLKKLICVSDETIVACASTGLTTFDVAGLKCTVKDSKQGEMKVYNMAKYKNSLLLLCAKDNKAETDKFLDPSEIVFKLQDSQMSLKDFNVQTRVTLSAWRGFVFDQQNSSFISVSENGSSLIWLSEKGIFLKEKSYDKIGRGGFLGLAIDRHGYLYAATTRKIFVIEKSGAVLKTIETKLNVYDIAINAKGDTLVAVGHNNSVQIFVME